MSNTELIEEARMFTGGEEPTPRDVVPARAFVSLVTRLADALEESERDTEWEYTYADMAGDPDTAHFREWGGVPKERASYRRRKAGPWERVIK